MLATLIASILVGVMMPIVHAIKASDALLAVLNQYKTGNTRVKIEKSLDSLRGELSDFWRATVPDAVNISVDFSPQEFAAAPHHLKPGKASGPDSICPELLIHAGPGLKF